MQIPVYITEPVVVTSSLDELQLAADGCSTASSEIRWSVPRSKPPPTPRPPTESELRGKRNRHAKWNARNKAAKKARRRNRK